MKKLLALAVILVLAFPLFAQENPPGITLAAMKKAAQDSGFDVTDDFFFHTDLNYNGPVAGISVQYETHIEYEDGSASLGCSVSILEFRNSSDAQAFERDNDSFFHRDTRAIRNGRFAARVSFEQDDEDISKMENTMFADFKLIMQGKPIQK